MFTWHVCPCNARVASILGRILLGDTFLIGDTYKPPKGYFLVGAAYKLPKGYFLIGATYKLSYKYFLIGAAHKLQKIFNYLYSNKITSTYIHDF